MSWKKLLEATKASLNDHMRLRHEYLTAENRILHHQFEVARTDARRPRLQEMTNVNLGSKVYPSLISARLRDGSA